MPTLAYQAHFDGEHIQLDEDAQIPKGAKLVVTVVSPAHTEEAEWLAISRRGFGLDYGDDEPEYTLEDCIHEAR